MLLIGTVRSVGRRLLDGIDPDLSETAEHAIEHVTGVERIDRLRLRWVGHRLHGDARVVVTGTTVQEADAVAAEVAAQVRRSLHVVEDFEVRPIGA